MAAHLHGESLTRWWQRAQRLPGGNRLFSCALTLMVPYSGSIRPRILELRPGYVRLQVRDQRGVRNHLRSFHAIALANMLELASGLALISALPRDRRAILTGLEVRYHKKGRGTLTAVAEHTLTEAPQQQITATVMDAKQEVIATASAEWRVGSYAPPTGQA